MAILFKAIHKTVSPGSQEPKENMGDMASEVIKCIGYAVINKKPIQCFWGIGGNHRFVSNDESSLKAFNLHSIFRWQQHVLTSTVSIFCENKDCTAGKPLERFDRQPLPDYKWWEETGQLHYLSYEARRVFPRGPWDKMSWPVSTRQSTGNLLSSVTFSFGRWANCSCLLTLGIWRGSIVILP